MFRSSPTQCFARIAFVIALLFATSPSFAAEPKTVVKPMDEVFSVGPRPNFTTAVSETTIKHSSFFTDFDGGAPGWGVVDFRASQPNAWHIVSGTHACTGNSWWCGQSGFPNGDGYDNNWVQLLQTAVPITLTGTSNNNLTFKYKIGSEPGYDYGWVMIHDAASISAWDTLGTFTGDSGTNCTSATLPIPNSWTTRPQPIKLLFVFGSDLNVSTADSAGAFTGWTLDDVKVTGQGNVVTFFDDMESGSAKWTATGAHPGAFWHLEDGPQTTPPASCSFLFTSVFVPFNGSTYGTVADFTDAMLTSPPIDLDKIFVNGNSTMRLQFDDWVDLPCDYGMYWSVWVSGSSDKVTWTPWRNATSPIVFCGGTTPQCTENDFIPVDPWNTNRTGIQPGTRYLKLGFRLRDEKQLTVPEQGSGDPTPMLHLGQNSEALYLDNIGLYYIYTLSGVETVEGAPAASKAKLDRIYPNPFNPSTTIEFSVPKNGTVHIAIYDIQGRKAATLVKDTMAAGVYRVRWNGKSDDGRALASGVYFARLEAAGSRDMARLMMLK